ncbi:MAG: helix-turn-helix transcriptional regulator [Clostridia bacterium]|nr:helix-turn-helix transcriptional regulator [Clostridia bacterium]
MDTKKPIEKCEFLCVHEDVVQEVLRKMPEEETLFQLADFFKVFGDSTRIRILYALRETELCVCDIASLLGLTQTAVSHQLRVLKTSKLVKARRNGKTVFYSLDDDHIHRILDMGICHLEE